MLMPVNWELPAWEDHGYLPRKGCKVPYYDKARKQWRGTVRVRDRNGEEIRQTQLFPTKTAAREWERKTKDLVKTQLTNLGFLEAYNSYLEWCEKKYTKNTLVEKITLGKRFFEFLGSDKPLHEITPKNLSDFTINTSNSKSNNRANRDRKNLLAFWNWSQKILDVQTNPAAKLDILPHHREEQYVPPERDIRAILMAATREEKIFLNCYLQTAARRSEVFRWKWNEDIDFMGRQVRLGTRKSRDGSMKYVWIPMTNELFEDLQWLYKHRNDRETEYVWVVPEGPYAGQPYSFRRKFLRGLCSKAGVKAFGFHSLRRYAASLLASKGVPLKVIQAILRHESLHTTERYVKRLNEDLRTTMELLNTNPNDTQTDTQTKKGSHLSM